MLCECECGQETKLATKTAATHGHIKGQPLRFVKGHNGRTPVAARFWAKVTPAPADQCWEWAAFKDKGYGRIMINGRTHGAHRVAWTLLRGEIPEGLTIEHECRNPGCVNPWHMDLWPNEKNAAGAVNQHRGKTHCLRGHEFTAENTRVLSAGRRSCRECEMIRTRKYRAKQK